MSDFEEKSSQDTAWKDVLDTLFPDFVNYCFPELYAAIHWGIPWQSLDKELHAITNDSLTGNRFVDKLIQVQLKNGKIQLLLIHIEVQGQKDEDFEKRMFTYGYRIYDKYQEPVFSCAVLTDENASWRPSHFAIGFGESQMRIDYCVIKLIDYRKDIAKLEESSNPFANVILTQLQVLSVKRSSDEQRKAVKYALTKRLYEKGYAKETIKSLLLFLDWLISLPEDLDLLYSEEISQLEEQSKMPYVSSFERRGIEKGIQQGMQQGIQEGLQQGLIQGEALFLKTLLTKKFGSLAELYTEIIDQADTEQLVMWGYRILEAKSIEEVFKN